jgi:hypothetical protein
MIKIDPKAIMEIAITVGKNSGLILLRPVCRISLGIVGIKTKRISEERTITMNPISASVLNFIKASPWPHRELPLVFLRNSFRWTQTTAERAKALSAVTLTKLSTLT